MPDSFTPKLGRIGWKQGTRLDRYINRVMRAAHAAGQVAGVGRKGFTGSHIGRGGAFGTLAGVRLYPGGQRRVIVKARIAKLKLGDLGAARAHLRYIQRDGVTPEGEPGQLYGPDADEINGTQFLDTCEDDRHQFRLIVSPEDAADLADLKPFIRDLMAKAEADLNTRLDWVAVDHYNTGHPHTHIVIRGMDDRGRDLVIARDYMSHGFRMRARELATLELGPEIESDVTLKLAREVEAERFTRLDRALLDHTDRGYLVVSAMPPSERQTHTAHMGRLKTLAQLNLARERQTGVWEVAPDLEARLKALGSRGDIIKTMHRMLREAGIERPAGSFALFDPRKINARIVGRVAGIGLADEINDRHYLVIDGIDGRVHYADAGNIPPERVPEKGMIVSLEAQVQGDSQHPSIRLRILSYINLEKLIEAEGATWLDKELLSRKREPITDQGFGVNTRDALARRRQWLVSKSLGDITTEGAFQPAPDMLNQLRQRDIRQASAALSKDLGLSFAEPVEGERITGTYTRGVDLASGRFAIIAKSNEFVLVPWQREFEKMRGTSLSGYRTSGGFEWDVSKPRRLGLAIS
jgi:type IV secretory pathway VirD2 relaxase